MCRPLVAPLLWGRGGAAWGCGAQGAPGLLCGVQNPRAKGSCKLSPPLPAVRVLGPAPGPGEAAGSLQAGKTGNGREFK